jgi:fructoselysine-6-phosphate deglycase
MKKTIKQVFNIFRDNRKPIEDTIDKIHKEGISNIFLIGCGGTYSLMIPWKYFMDSESDLPVFIENAAELKLKDHKQLGKGSLCLFASASGDTKEIVEIMEYCKDRGAQTLSFLTKEDCPMASKSDHIFLTPLDNDFVLFFIGIANVILRILFLRNEFSKYERFADQLYSIGEALDNAVKFSNSRCIFYAARNYDAPWHLVIGSGAGWGEAYCYAMCVMEEMQWIRTKSVTAAEFFHGTLELVEKDTPAILMFGDDSSRPLMDRAYKFLKNLTDEILILDTKDIELPVDEEFRSILTPVVLTAMTQPLSLALQVERNHSLDVRRYYRQMNY